MKMGSLSVSFCHFMSGLPFPQRMTATDLSEAAAHAHIRKAATAELPVIDAQSGRMIGVALHPYPDDGERDFAGGAADSAPGGRMIASPFMAR
jgi:hypothetical protein